MEKLPGNAGWQWIKGGFALFRKQPTEMSTLFLSYVFLMLAMGIVPLFGQILPMVLVPVFSISFLQACANIERGKKVYPNLLLAGFRSPAFMRLVRLGLLYLLAAVLAIAASAMIDGGVFWNIITGQSALDASTVRGSHMSLAMIFAAVVYTPAAMAFWYAAPLVAWQNMGLGKAMFFSFFAVKRAGRAFFIYGLAWLAISIFLPAVVSGILGLIFGRTAIIMLVLLPLSLVMTIIMYCSFYPNYTDIFGKPQTP
ncbi:hypothetical protein SAMN06265795_1207 [Noviherbaspirillum humi]|uniref:Transmembrane protein n=1 Tax=Noviherbaspirillum humi TaxID=1688639 RepID=A0A239L795_9BURK|nr:BPSS1780 family membrane protein [Noviherbaspirillum humi]SNT26150.1 hypothetical protein SAMN06265795_1207 [Noviherbaspirillum humi]